jgi:Initiator Replication protein
MTVQELREWLHIEETELTLTGSLRAWVIDQAQKELNEKVSLSFTVEAIRSGRKVTGWRFSVVDNKPKTKVRKAGAVSLPPEVRAEDERLGFERWERTKARWLEGSEEARQAWLTELPEIVRAFAPKGREEPRRFFLSALADLFEPKLPGL